MESLVQAILELQSGRNREKNWHLVFERFYPSVVRMFEGHRIPKDDCRDLAQETFLTAFRSIGSLRETSHFPGWLFAIARNTLLNDLGRKSAKKRSGIEVGCEDFSEAEPIAVVERVKDDRPGVEVQIVHRELLATMFRKMPAKMRRCCHLRAEGYKYKEIALILGIAEGTVKHQLYEARQMSPRELRYGFDDALGET